MKKIKSLIKDEETKEILMWLGIVIGLSVVAYLLVGFGDILWAFSGSEAYMGAMGSTDGCPSAGIPGTGC